MQLMRDAGEADIYNLRFFVPEEFVRLCYASADAVLNALEQAEKQN